MKRALSLLLLLPIAACGKSAAEAVVKQQLIDPDSAKFGEFTKSPDGKHACLAVNSKNSFGGYTGEQQWMLEKTGSGWRSMGNIDSEAATHQGCLDAIKHAG